MGQRDIVNWLVDMRRRNPEAMFSKAEIGAAVGMDSGNVSRSVDKLVDQGLLVKRVISVNEGGRRRGVFAVSNRSFERITGEPVEVNV